ncbi:hypothetical protein ACFSW8_14425 [Rubritalea tangerina]|uniref:Uncharacterized protein n=1 Tax=Rubritalea tangerina TaxID=430798 RepID=A0ABW4ZE45_9BACT
MSWEQHRQGVKQAQKQKPVKASDSDAMTKLQAEIVQLEGVQQMQNEDEDVSFVVVPSKLLQEYASRMERAQVGGDLFSNDRKVEEILNISDQEKMQLQRGWREMQRRMKKAQLAKVEVSDGEDGSVQIAVPELSEQISEIGRQYQAEVGAVLGENRGKAFAAIKQLDSAFEQAGGEVKYSVKMESTGDGFWRYHIKQSGGAGSRAWVGSKIPQSLRHLTEVAEIRSELDQAPEEDEN